MMCGIHEALWSRIAPRILTLGLTWFPILIWILFLFIIIYNIKTRKAFQELGKFTEGVVRFTMSQERLNSLAILSMENKLASTISFDDIITEFAELKACKIKF